MSKKKQPLPMKHVPKGWGWERWIVNCPEYCGKLLFFNKGKRCSWHFHVGQLKIHQDLSQGDLFQ